MQRIKLKKGDQVQVIQGKDSGQFGKIEKIDAKSGLVTVAGRNLYKRHLKPRSEGDRKTGGIVDIPRPIKISKVILICPKCQKTTRVAYRVTKGDKSRICRKCSSDI